MGFWRPAAAALLALLVAFPAVAADLDGHGVPGQCLFADQSQLPLLPEDEIELRVTTYYDEAKAAVRSEAVIGSKSPAFLWARETEFQCGKAIGYLKGGFINEESVQKCDCFYGRYARFR
jgi:hypothetical protein